MLNRIARLKTHKTLLNFLLIISALSFFCLEIGGVYQLFAFPFAVIALILILRKIDLQKELECSVKLKVFSFFTSLSTLIYGVKGFYFVRNYDLFMKNPVSGTGRILRSVGLNEGSSMLIFTVPAALAAVIAFYFVFSVSIIICKRLISAVKTYRLLDFSRAEKTAYAIIFSVFAVVTVLIYQKTDVFFHANDLIFQADTYSNLVFNSSFLCLTNGNNILSQPLFMIFAFNFFGIPYLLSLVLPFAFALPVFTSFVHIALLIFTATIFARLLKLTGAGRILFVVLFFCMFSPVMFTLLIDQYVTAVFYFVLFTFILVEKKRLDAFYLYASTGTLLTSAFASFFILKCSPVKKLFRRFKKIVLLGIGFIILTAAFCRSDVFYSVESAKNILQWAGAVPSERSQKKDLGTDIQTRVLEFIEGATYFFISPRSEIIFAEDSYDEKSGLLDAPAHYGYETASTVKFSAPGLVIIILSILSAFINRKKPFARFSVFWLGFYFVLCACLGWGLVKTQNCLFLYSLYFNWAYFVLLFMLLQNILSRLHIKTALTFVCAAFSTVLLFINIPSFMNVIKFGLTYYPL